MKSLQTIQKLSKLAKVLCKIVFICSIVGASCCALGIITLALIPGDLVVGDVTFHAMVEKSAEMSIGTCYGSMAVAIILCAGEAVISKIAENYFKNELIAGTPFTFDGAKELIRLGIINICVSVGSAIIASIVYEVFKLLFTGVEKLDLSNATSIGLGITFIIVGVIFRYGAELNAQSQEKTEEIE